MGAGEITTPVTSAVMRDGGAGGASRGNEVHRGRARGSPAAQELPVTRTHEGETPLHQANGSIAQRGCLPRLPLEASSAEQRLGDLPIGSLGEMTIKGAHHQHEAVTALPRERKRFSTVIRSPAGDSPPQAQRCLRAPGEIIIERHDDRQRLVAWSVTQPKTKLANAVSDDHISTIRTDVLGMSTSKLCEVKGLSPKPAIRRRLEQNDRGQHLRPPEHGHPIGGKPWVDRESSAPNARRGRPLSCPRNRRRRRLLAPSFCSLLDRPGYGAGIPTQNPADRGASSSHVRSKTANRRPVASLVPQDALHVKDVRRPRAADTRATAVCGSRMDGIT